MDYSPGLHMIALVLTDGRCAILQTGTMPYHTCRSPVGYEMHT